jgi:hypothetical protein
MAENSLRRNNFLGHNHTPSVRSGVPPHTQIDSVQILPVLVDKVDIYHRQYPNEERTI